ncbi:MULTISPECIES: ribonuclease HII [unclassified Leptolyngbya]|uniref:ribonuclease HII n=1 Tax=unclassified Leptolyngbya TaxID=2650499 RepID=UPI0016855185|nr:MULTISPECIES: ribonuclease HII [unclassified Leptolyngbya]MBD1912338.1 ribonuclease HII [Leptolyngbya sp. FACHB-8]MBD2158026.1 ribonuclease HII [Leptolyngbya sp. FACHB-16]
MRRTRRQADGFLQLTIAPATEGINWVAGVDEVGRGALFGPVVAAAIILSDAAAIALQQAGVTDSKLLTPARRESLAREILSQATACHIGYASVREIDRMNILRASLLAMQRAIARLSPTPDLCRIDGNQTIPQLLLAQEAVVKGDQHHVEIAAASIVAKVWRDRLITRLDRRYPGYDLAQNKGYGTQKHRQAIATLGLTPQHRRSFTRSFQP